MQITNTLLLLCLGSTLALAAPAPARNTRTRTMRFQSSRGGSARVSISGNGINDKNSPFASLFADGPYNINDSPGFVSHSFGTHSYAANDGPSGSTEGLDAAIEEACGKLMGGEVEKRLGARAVEKVKVRTAKGEWMEAGFETFEARAVDRESCETEMKDIVMRYKRCGNDGCRIKNGWSYTHDGHVKHVMNWV